MISCYSALFNVRVTSLQIVRTSFLALFQAQGMYSPFPVCVLLFYLRYVSYYSMVIIFHNSPKNLTHQIGGEDGQQIQLGRWKGKTEKGSPKYPPKQSKLG